MSTLKNPWTKPEIGIGVIGLGMGRHSFVAEQCPGSTMRVRGLCDTNPELLEKIATQHAVAFTTPDYRELVQNPAVDVVAIYSPDAYHYEHIMAALEAGKHVVCTKPLVTCLAHARAVRKASRRTGLKLLVGQTCRFIPSFIAAKNLMQQGSYGRPLYIEATYNHDMRSVYDATPWRYQVPQDLLFGGLCHPMDLALWLGGPIAEVSAFAAVSGLDPRAPLYLPDNYAVNLRFESGAIGRVIGLYGCPHPEGMPYIELTVCGTLASSHGNKVTWEPQAGQRTVEDIGGHLPAVHDGTEYSGHLGEIARYFGHMEECLRHDLQPAPGVMDGLRCIAALEAVRQSVESGRSVAVEAS